MNVLLIRAPKINLHNFFLVFLMLDILVLPKLFFATPISFYFLLVFLCFYGRLELHLLIKFTVLLLILLSSVLSGVIRVSGDDFENVKRAIQLALVLSLFFFDYGRVDYQRILVLSRKVLCLFYLISFSLFIAFVLDSDFYARLMTLLYPESLGMMSENISNKRYSFHFTDPNSFGYFLVLVYALLLFVRFSIGLQGIFLVLSLLMILGTQSRGALIALAMVLLFYVAFSVRGRARIRLLVFLFFLSVVLVFTFYEFIVEYLKLLEARSEIEKSMGSELGGGRLDKWEYFLGNPNINPFFGQGYYLEKDGQVFRPHSDFIRLNYSYGIIIYFVLISFFLDFRRPFWILWVAFFVPFFINTVIDDFRIFGLFVLAFLWVKNGLDSGAINYRRIIF